MISPEDDRGLASYFDTGDSEYLDPIDPIDNLKEKAGATAKKLMTVASFSSLKPRSRQGSKSEDEPSAPARKASRGWLPEIMASMRKKEEKYIGNDEDRVEKEEEDRKCKEGKDRKGRNRKRKGKATGQWAQEAAPLGAGLGIPNGPMELELPDPPKLRS